MSWSSATQIMSGVMNALLDWNANESCREAVYECLISPLQENDWDGERDILGIDPVYDRMLREQHPDWFEDEDSIRGSEY